MRFTVWVTSLARQEASAQVSSPEVLPPALIPDVPRVHLDGETTARSLVYKVLPETLPAAQETNTYGTVVLRAVIGTDGRTHNLAYVSGPQPLVHAAMEAVRWYQYRVFVTSVGAEEVDTTVVVLFPPPQRLGSKHHRQTVQRGD